MKLKPVHRLKSKYNIDIKNQCIDILKANLCMSKKQFKVLFIKNADHLGTGRWRAPLHIGNLSEMNWVSIIRFLHTKNLITVETINGMMFFIATPTLVHSELDNLYKL